MTPEVEARRNRWSPAVLAKMADSPRPKWIRPSNVSTRRSSTSNTLALSVAGKCEPGGKHRSLEAREGLADLSEPVCYCNACERSFFPSADSPASGRTPLPILDFIHPIERLHETSRVLFSDSEQAWEGCRKWMALCWSGDTNEVIGQLEAEQAAVGSPDGNTPDGDVRHVLAETLTYLGNNVSRMNSPAYRQAGLPITSCLILQR